MPRRPAAHSVFDGRLANAADYPPGSSQCTGGNLNRTPQQWGDAVRNGWSLVFTLPGGQTITSGWNASYSPSSGQVTARNVFCNGTVPPGRTKSLDFQAIHTGDSAWPASYSLNGAACTIA